MKKIFIVFCCAALLSSCSISMDQIMALVITPTSQPRSLATGTSPFELVPTSTAEVIQTATYTLTPTLVGYKSPTPTELILPTEAVTETPTPLYVSNLTNPLVDLGNFVSVSLSGETFYRSGSCEPLSVKFTAQAGDAQNTAFVVLSVRFKSKQTGATGKWAGITMQNSGMGTFTHELIPGDIKGLDLFKDAWVEYQLVATDSKTKEVGRTGIFKESLTLLDCLPTATPSPTTTPLKP